MNIQQHAEQEKRLIQFMGKEKFHSACKEIASTITANNLDAAPKVLKDFLSYVTEEVAISQI